MEERGSEAVRALRVAHGHLLAREGLYEDAVEELLSADAPAEAWPFAEQAILGVIERLDSTLAERWLQRLADVAPVASPALVAGELMLAIGGEDYRRAERVVERVAGERERLARASGLLAALMAWAYAILARPEEAKSVLAVAPDDPATASRTSTAAPRRRGRS